MQIARMRVIIVRKVLYIFSYLNDGDVEWLATAGKKATVPGGSVLIRKGRRIANVFILLKGRLSVLVGDEQTHELATLQQGEIVGELSFLDSRPPSATVVAATESVLLAIPRDQLALRLRRDTAFSARFYRALGVFLANRLRQTVNQMGFSRIDALAEEEEALDEIDPELLDAIALAARRFETLLARLGAGRSG